MTRAPEFRALVVVGVLALATHAVLAGEQALGRQPREAGSSRSRARSPCRSPSVTTG